MKEYLEKARTALSLRNVAFFADYLSSKDYWRIYKEFLNKTLFLDVEAVEAVDNAITEAVLPPRDC